VEVLRDASCRTTSGRSLQTAHRGTSAAHAQKNYYKTVFRSDHATCHLFIRGVVCWLDLSDPDFAQAPLTYSVTIAKTVLFDAASGPKAARSRRPQAPDQRPAT
jgi:hypothetical protein